MITALGVEHRHEVDVERLHSQLVRFQGIAIGARRFGHATIWSDGFYPSRYEIMKRLDAYQAMSDQCLNDEWFQFARLHIRSGALHMSDLLEKKMKLSAEIRVRCATVPRDAPSEHPTKEEAESIASIITRFNELESVYEQIWDAIGSLSEEDILPNLARES